MSTKLRTPRWGLVRERAEIGTIGRATTREADGAMTEPPLTAPDGPAKDLSLNPRLDPAMGAARRADRGLELAERIMTHALRTGLGPGGRLPTERQLAHDLGVTRSSVRYALSIMEADGHISREVGRGTYLRSPDLLGGFPSVDAG